MRLFNRLACRSRKQRRTSQPITRPGIEHCDWCVLSLLLPTPTIQFSLDHKRRNHKRNRCSASDSVVLIFTRSYRSTRLITTPATTSSLLKTSLKKTNHAIRWKVIYPVDKSLSNNPGQIISLCSWVEPQRRYSGAD